MRAISPIANYGIQLIEAPSKRGMDSTGTIVEYTDSKPVHAQFHQGGLTEWEQIAALENFDFSGLPEGVNPLTRVSMYDTEAAVAHIEDEDERERFRERLDKRLRHLAKLYPNEFLIVEKPPAPLPWPSYDETPWTDATDGEGNVTPGIETMQRMTGISPEIIRLYEVEHKNRPSIIGLCERLEAEQLAENAEKATGAGVFSVAV